MNQLQKIQYLLIGIAAVGIVMVSIGLTLNDFYFWQAADSYFYAAFIATIIISYLTIRKVK